MPEEYLGKAMSSPWIYSFMYNLLYMLPSTVACVAVLAVLMKPLKKYIAGDDLIKAKIKKAATETSVAAFQLFGLF